MDATSLALLERVLRERLAPELGNSPETHRAAHLHARAVLAMGTAEALENEASHLTETGELGSAQALRERAAQLRAEARELEHGALLFEGRAMRSPAPERFAELAQAIRALRHEADARELGNQIVQAEERIGRRAAAQLVQRLERQALHKRVPLGRDLLVRLETFRQRAEPPGEADRPMEDELSELMRRAEQIAEAAPAMEREALRDAIEAVGARLKLLQAREDLERRADLAQRLRRAFGLLTRISREYQPGWTPVLAVKEQRRDWEALARDAERRLAAREARRAEERERARREELVEALARWREHERRVIFDEALQRARKHLYELQAAGLDEAARSGAEAGLRAEAAVAARASRTPAELKRLADTLESHRELFASGRDFRLLRRIWGMREPIEPPPEAEDVVEAVPEAAAAAETLREIEQEWPEALAAAQGAGRGERILIVGGLPNRPRLEPLRAFFGWADVEWLESYRERQADYRALRRRIREGRFDRVIVLARFCGHDVSDSLGPACRRHGVSYHVHPGGVSIPSLAHYVYGATSDARGATRRV